MFSRYCYLKYAKKPESDDTTVNKTICGNLWLNMIKL